MSFVQNLDLFCIFCYKTVNCTKQTTSNTDSLKKFITLLSRFMGWSKTEKLTVKHVELKLLFKSCEDCSKIADQFCEQYNQLMLLELQLDLKLDKLVRKLEHANKVPTRWIHLNKVLEETFPNDLEMRKQRQNDIRELRISVAKAAHQRSLQSQPRVLVEKLNVVQLTAQALPSINIIGQDNPQIFDDGNDNMDSNENNFSDTEADKWETEYVPEISEELRVTDKIRDSEVGALDTATTNKKAEVSASQKRNVNRSKNGCKQDKHKNGKYSRGKIMCPKCGSKLSSTSALKIHLEYHKDPKVWQFKCNDCKKKFATKYDLAMHSRKHTREQPYVCQICGEKYGYKISLRKHLANKHPGNDDASSDPFNGGLTTQNRKNARSKTVQNFTRKLFQRSNRVKGKTCHKCGKILSSDISLRVHLEYHKDPEDWKWQCGECGKKFARKADLNHHLKKHTREQPYVCRFCGEKYGYRISLRKHLSSKHADEMEVNEEIKKREIITKKKHKLNPLPTLPKGKVHKNKELRKSKGSENTQKLKCKDCGDEFDIDKELWVHQNDVHEDKVCLECGKQFSRKDHLSLHLEYHKDPKEWKFECKVCGKKCAARYKLKEHMARHAKKKNVPVQIVKDKVALVEKCESDSSKLKLLRKGKQKLVVKQQQKRYGLRKNMMGNVSSEEKSTNELNDNEFVGNDLNEEICANEYFCEFDETKDTSEEIRIRDSTVNGIKNSSEDVKVGFENIIENNDHLGEIFNEVEEINKCGENEGMNLNISGEDSLWTRKGTCFGDGTLVEFEDLD